jgi:2-iminobutanoate/2-iminopropanoate deaminase
MTMKRPIRVTDAPQAIGPYSQGQLIELNGSRLIYTSGQIALVPETGELMVGGVAEQTEQVMKNLAAVLHGAGCQMADVVKTTVYLADMQDFQAMNEVYAKHFGDALPARTTITAAGLPKSARVEIDAVAWRRAV